MSYTIALAGKGGTGKTTVAGLLIRYMVEKGKKPVLAVDADANANLNEVLGVEARQTIGDAREEMKKGGLPGMTKDIFMEMRIQESLVESEGFDLIIMGRPEGQGCYCAANTLLSQFIEKLSENYPYLVVDNEAGMEHISRLTTREIDVLLIVSDSSRRGIQAAIRIGALTKELGLKIEKNLVIINLVEPKDLTEIKEWGTLLQEQGLSLLGVIPKDELIYEFDKEGKPTSTLPEQSKARSAAFKLFEGLFDN
ncbi:MAG: AAA family ATPase [Thermodesulfobacteriota bacterium]|jgi:CO dehydrogenase maturation factor